MALIHRTGDLFDSALPALAHGVNCEGIFGSGIAPEFGKRWPNLFSTYQYACKNKILTLGSVLPWQEGDSPTIYNMATQEIGGRNADLDAIVESMSLTLQHAEENDIPVIGIPRIGSGVGGLKWLDVEKELLKLAMNSKVDLIVYSL
jgi:O-acetyl-ADP-ribose deacetylase (regulator of RNase III)